MVILKNIIIYPIKGIKGIQVSEANVFERGLENDRRFMLVNKDNQFISQRTHPKLALLSATIEKNEMIVSTETESVTISLNPEVSGHLTAKLFDDYIKGGRLKGEASAFFSHFLEEDVILIYQDSMSDRIRRPSVYPDEISVSWADGYPYLAISKESLELLNSKLDIALPMDRFRPNFVVEGESPHGEDEWKEVKIGEVNFRNIKPCVRCQVTTIDQKSLKIGKEPLRTLATYRKHEKGVIFGTNLISLENGIVKIEDVIHTR